MYYIHKDSMCSTYCPNFAFDEPVKYMNALVQQSAYGIIFLFAATDYFQGPAQQRADGEGVVTALSQCGQVVFCVSVPLALRMCSFLIHAREH